MSLERKSDFTQFGGAWTDEEVDEFKRDTTGFRMANSPFFLNPERPTIVCLCGSTWFFDAFSKLNLEETLAGKIVLSVASDRQTEEKLFAGLSQADLERTRQNLEALHLRKIDLADEILVINLDGYVGEGTAREVRYAQQIGKPVRWLEPERIPTHLKEAL